MSTTTRSVFVNRYRDADAVIRSECISALGSWMKLDPDYWIDGDYLRYIGWVLSDEVCFCSDPASPVTHGRLTRPAHPALPQSKDARRESVRALFSLYQKDAYLGKLHHFTDRFKQQLVDMAVGEHDLAVRIQALQVVRQIDAHGLLEDERQRDEVAMLVFEKEPRVRVAAAHFFRGLVDEQVEEMQGELDVKHKNKTARGRKVGGAGRKSKQAEKALTAAIEYKVLAQLLAKYGKKLDGAPTGEDTEDEDADSQRRRANGSEDLSVGDLAPGRAGGAAEGEDAGESGPALPRGRVAFAVEALWGALESLQDWQAMLEYVLKDHSAAAAANGANGHAKKGRAAKGRGGKKAARANGDAEDEEMEDAEAEEEEEEEEDEEEQLPEEVRLSEEEETLFIEVLLSCLTRVTTATATKKKVRLTLPCPLSPARAR